MLGNKGFSNATGNTANLSKLYDLLVMQVVITNTLERK